MRKLTRFLLPLILTVWFVGAFVAGATGRLRDAALPPPAFALLLTIVAVLAVWLYPKLGQRVQQLGVGPLVAIHLIRLVAGINFLILAHQGVLPDEFALVAGWGDIAVGVAVIPILMFCVPAVTSAQRLWLLVWNTAGLLDILTVLGNGMRLFAESPEVALPFTTLPLALLPLFVVPLVIATHLWIFAWTTRVTKPLSADPIVRPPEEEDEEEPRRY